MTPVAADQMSHFEEHVQSALGENARRAREQLDSALEPFAPRVAEEARTPFLAGLADREPELHREVTTYLALAGSTMGQIRENPSEPLSEMRPPDCLSKLEAWAAARDEHAGALQAAEDPQRQQEMQQELSELEARVQLAARIDDVRARRVALKRAAALRGAYSALATNRITMKQRELSETVVAGTLAARLREELQSLRCEHLPVSLQPRTAVGETQVRLRLAGARGAPAVSEIASEGEQRALALSFFLAEVSTSENDGGLVIDDPVSSLDDERREYTRLPGSSWNFGDDPHGFDSHTVTGWRVS